MVGTIILILRLCMIVALYVFVGFALLLVWRDIRSQSDLIILRQIPPIILTKKNQDPSQSYRGILPEIIVGRDLACEFILDDQTISARHARLSHHHNQWWIEDLESTNGTFLNQAPISTPTVIVSGDELCFGQVSVQVSI
jgi:pSer/pThr/pTyr-binding forkhead associated (FHA) protein